MWRGFPLALAAALLLVAVGCDLAGLAGYGRFQEEFQQSHPMPPGGRLSLESFNGRIEIRGWDRDSIDISGVRYASSPEALASLIIDVDASGDLVRIRTRRQAARSWNSGVNYLIRVPRRTELEHISTSNGSIEVAGVEGRARLSTSNGAVTVDRLAGELEVETSNGPVRVTLGEAGLETPIRLRTSNGPIELTLEKIGPAGAILRTSNGPITLRLPPDASADIEATTSNGSISVDLDAQFQGRRTRNRLEGKIGAGGPLLRLATSNGPISVRRRS